LDFVNPCGPSVSVWKDVPECRVRRSVLPELFFWQGQDITKCQFDILEL